MARLNVVAVSRWGAGGTNFRTTPIVLGLSVSDDTGHGVQGLLQASFHLRVQDDPSASADGEIFDFHEHSGPSGAGEYSLLVRRPGGVQWPADQVFLYVTVGQAANRGQTVCGAKFWPLSP